MNANTRRALLLDAYYQVVDNWIYRLMMLFVLTLVAVSFLVGLREHEVRVLFGAWTLSYGDVIRYFGRAVDVNLDVQQVVVQSVQDLLTENLIGQFGMMVCLAATSFFAPRLLEKGAADIVFAKPVSRLSLLLSRYVAGLLFVGSLSIVLVFGVWLGLIVSSGYDDTGFLWGALTLLYLFSILHAVSICIGVFTRSSVAAMLLALLFFVIAGALQWSWETKEYVRASGAIESLRQDIDATAPDPRPTPSDGDDTPTVLRVFGGLLDAAHFALPKLSDADVITRQMRRALVPAEDVLTDEVAHVTLRSGDSGFRRIQPPLEVVAHDLSVQPALWIARDESGKEVARVEARRRSRIVVVPRSAADDPKSKPTRLNSNQLGAEVVQRVKLEESATTEPVSGKSYIDGSFAQFVRWTTADHELGIHVAPVGDWALEIRQEAARTWLTADEREKRLTAFREGVRLARPSTLPSPEEWYGQRFGWRAPLAFNSLFSVGSSLLFAGLMLLLAWWKLRRIDF